MGTVVISLDAELGWGFVDYPDPPTPRLSEARRGWTRLLDLFEKYDLPATWGVVGHLFLDGCDGVHDGHPTPPDWFVHERETWRDHPEVRFGNGLVEAILESPVDHEIACHTFAHVEFGEDWTSRELARAELDASIEVARNHGVEFTSFIYPRNNIGHRDLLADAGFTCYRGYSMERRGQSRFRVLRPLQKLTRATVTSPPLVRPHLDEYGTVCIPGSMYLFGYHDALWNSIERVWRDPTFEQARRGIERAISADDGVFHPWFHPHDLTEVDDVARLESVLEYIAERRDDTSLEVATMRTVADRFLESAAPESASVADSIATRDGLR